jgi:hypothetical protein
MRANAKGVIAYFEQRRLVSTCHGPHHEIFRPRCLNLTSSSRSVLDFLPRLPSATNVEFSSSLF